MSVYGPTSVWLHVGGRDLTSDTFNLAESNESAFEEVHAFGDSWEEHLPVGIGKVTLQAGGGLYASDTVMLEALQETRETKQLVAWGMSGQTIGKEAVLMDGTYAGKWKRVAERNALTKAEAEHTVSGVYRRGYVLHPLGAETADGDTLAGAAPKGGVDFYDSHLNPLVPVGTIDLTTDYLYGMKGVARDIVTSNATSDSVICAELYGLKTGDWVWIASHAGSTPDINGLHQVTVVDAFSFTLDDVADITVGGTGGTFQRIVEHGLVTGDDIVISGQVAGTPDLNGAWAVTRIDNFRFTLDTVGDITDASTGASWRRVSSTGYVAHLHLFALTGCVDCDWDILDSADDDTYTPVTGGTLGPITPAQFTGGTRTDTIETTTQALQRYVAVQWAFDTPSGANAEFFIGLARS